MAFWDEGAYRGRRGKRVETTAANVADIEMAHKLIREDDDFVNVDEGFVGIEIRTNEHLSKIKYGVNEKKGAERKREAWLYKEPMKHLKWIGEPKREQEIEYLKSKGRSKVEHIFYIEKGLFGYLKVSEGSIPQQFKVSNANLLPT